MEYITFNDFIDLYRNIISCIDDYNFRYRIFNHFHKFLWGNNIQYDEKKLEYQFLLIDILRFYTENKHINFKHYEKLDYNYRLVGNKICYNKLYNFLVYIDEFYTEYDCKDDDENKEINDFLYEYRKIIQKYL